MSLELEDDDPVVGPFDVDELLRWAETYGHPEEWAKRAQAAHSRAEHASALSRRLTDALVSVSAVLSEDELSDHEKVMRVRDVVASVKPDG